MSRALKIHHDVIRSCIQKHCAYEVKTIGDAFMIAINDADKAVLLANDIQVDLLNADWPAELAELPSSCVVYSHPFNGEAKLLFRGLRVRIGIHMGIHDDKLEEGGQVQVLYDKVAKGYDYYGPVTNTAARIEAAGFGGQTLMSAAVRTKLSVEVKKQCIFTAVGAIELRGVSEQMYLYQCLPKGLEERIFDAKFRKRPSRNANFTTTDSEDDINIKSIRGSYSSQISSRTSSANQHRRRSSVSSRLRAAAHQLSGPEDDVIVCPRVAKGRNSILSLDSQELGPSPEGDFDSDSDDSVNNDDLSYDEESAGPETEELLES